MNNATAAEYADYQTPAAGHNSSGALDQMVLLAEEQLDAERDVAACEEALKRAQERLRDIAEHTSPHRVQEAMRRGQEEAQRREPVVILVRPSSQFELELEQQEALRTWRGIQVAVG